MEFLIDIIKNAFEVDNNTAATLIISISVFIIGFLLAIITKILGEIYRRIRMRKTFIEIVKSMISSISTISKRTANVMYQIDLNNPKSISFEIAYSLQAIQNLNDQYVIFHNSFFQGVENIFRRNIHRKSFRICYNNLNNLNALEQRMLPEFEKFIEKYNVHINKWNDSIESFRQYYERLSIYYNGKKVDKETYEIMEELKKSIEIWKKSPNNTHFELLYKLIIVPQLEIIKKKPNSEFWKNNLEFEKLLFDVDICYRNLERLYLSYNATLKNNIIFYKNSQRLLFKSLMILKRG